MSPGEYEDETEITRRGAPRALRSQPELSWTDELGPKKVVLAGRTIVGSAPGADVRIADREMSRLHAELEPTERGTWIRDLGSRNGTYVENLQVTAALLSEEARLRLGSTALCLRYPTAPAPVELWPKESYGEVIGASTAMRELFVQMDRVAASDAPVLILGDTGTG